MSDSFAAPWTVTCQAPLSMGFPRQEYWSGLPFPSPRDLFNSGINSNLLHCRRILSCWVTGEAHRSLLVTYFYILHIYIYTYTHTLLLCIYYTCTIWAIYIYVLLSILLYIYTHTYLGKIPCRRKWPPTPVYLLGKFHGQRSLAGYSPWGCKRVRHDLVTKQQQ